MLVELHSEERLTGCWERGVVSGIGEVFTFLRLVLAPEVLLMPEKRRAP